MLNNKGNTLIEALFAFSIFITVIIMYISLINTINKQFIKLNHTYTNYYQKQLDLRKDDLTLTIKEVLRW